MPFRLPIISRGGQVPRPGKEGRGTCPPVSYIGDHYANDMPLETLARIACMGTTKLKYAFKQTYKCTITEYILSKRMAQAEHLLIDTDLTIGQISRSVGYKKTGNFSDAFRRNTGLLPHEYRKLSMPKA